MLVECEHKVIAADTNSSIAMKRRQMLITEIITPYRTPVSIRLRSCLRLNGGFCEMDPITCQWEDIFLSLALRK